MSGMEVISKIKRENLDERNYFKTLIEEAYNNEMLTNDDMVNLQMQILQLLDEKVYKYTGNDSTSIRKEVMDDILNSNSYTISIYLKMFFAGNFQKKKLIIYYMDILMIIKT